MGVSRKVAELGFLSIERQVYYEGWVFAGVIRNRDFEWQAGVTMRGEAFVILKAFESLSLAGLREFMNLCARYAKRQTDLSSVGRAIFNFRAPTNLCVAVAVVETVADQTARQIQISNPFDHAVDLLWYEVPVVYDLSQDRLLYYNQPQTVLDQFKGEIVWRSLRQLIEQVLTPYPGTIGSNTRFGQSDVGQQGSRQANRSSQSQGGARGGGQMLEQDQGSGSQADQQGVGSRSGPRDQVLISYHSQDREWMERLRTMLGPLKRAQRIQIWDDTQIQMGSVREQEIRSALERARIAVLLVSADYLDSDPIMTQQLPYLLAAAERQEVRIVWVMVRDCLVDETGIGVFQPAHDRSKPLEGLSKPAQDQVLKQIAEGIRSLLNPR